MKQETLKEYISPFTGDYTNSLYISTSTINAFVQPKIVGWYYFGKPNQSVVTKIGMTYKPNLVVRFFMRTLLDFYWIDN